MAIKHIIRFIVSVVVIFSSIVIGLIFFGVFAVIIFGIIGLFFLFALIFYLNRRWHGLFSWKKQKKTKRGPTEIVVEVEEEYEK